MEWSTMVSLKTTLNCIKWKIIFDNFFQQFLSMKMNRFCQKIDQVGSERTFQEHSRIFQVIFSIFLTFSLKPNLNLFQLTDSQETPNKIARTESSDHVFLQKIANTEPMDEDESGIEASSSCLEPVESSLRMINTHKLLLDENHQVIGIVEEIPFNAGDDTTVECLELTCADENEISFNEVVSSSQQSTCSSLLEDTGSFNPVSEHAIMRIMDYLNIPDRLNLSLTSKRFQTILKDNPNRFPLTLALDYEDKEAATGVFTRCYRTVKVQELKTPDTEERIEEIKETFKSIGSGIRDIQFLNCNLSFELLSSLITMMPNIISLQMENTILKPSESDVEWPELPALKKVRKKVKNVNF